jgi:hypothetical protein
MHFPTDSQEIGRGRWLYANGLATGRASMDFKIVMLGPSPGYDPSIQSGHFSDEIFDMRLVTRLIVATCFSFVSFSSFALSDDAQTRDYIEQHQAAIQAYASQENKAMPPIVEYQYGMKIDVVKLVRQTADTKSCQVMPRLMTYEDSTGQLVTLQYSALSECRNQN